MPDEFFEVFVRHFNIIRASAVYEANDLVVDFQD